MPENCDASCVKNIINTRLVAYIARHLADVCQTSRSPLFEPARTLASASRAACEAYRVAAEEGTLRQLGQPSGWKGCEDAEFLIEIAQSVRDGKTYDGKAARIRIDALTDKANAVTARLVRVQQA